MAQRLDARRAPDDDKSDPRHREDSFRYSTYGGFWKRSEFLACRQGRRMKTLDERAHFGGEMWLRARRSHDKVRVINADEE